jgi:hypothetical protein
MKSFPRYPGSGPHILNNGKMFNNKVTSQAYSIQEVFWLLENDSYIEA